MIFHPPILALILASTLAGLVLLGAGGLRAAPPRPLGRDERIAASDRAREDDRPRLHRRRLRAGARGGEPDPLRLQRRSHGAALRRRDVRRRHAQRQCLGLSGAVGEDRGVLRRLRLARRRPRRRRDPRPGAGSAEARRPARPGAAGAGGRRHRARLFPRSEGRHDHVLLRQALRRGEGGRRRRSRLAAAAPRDDRPRRRSHGLRRGGARGAPVAARGPLPRAGVARGLRACAGGDRLGDRALGLRAATSPLPLLHPEAGIRPRRLRALSAALRGDRRGALGERPRGLPRAADADGGRPIRRDGRSSRCSSAISSSPPSRWCWWRGRISC